MNKKRVKLSYDEREELTRWAEDKLFLYRMELKWSKEEEKNDEDLEENCSEEKKAVWEKLQKRIEEYEKLSEEEKQRERKEFDEFFARAEERNKKLEKQSREMFALLPKSVRRTVKCEKDFFDGIMSKKTARRLKWTCFKHRLILLLKDE